MGNVIPKKYIGIKKGCLVCSKIFQIRAENQKVCSDKCRSIYWGRTSGLDIPSASVGSISEMMVCADMLRKGYHVFRTVSNASFCDVVAIKGNEIMFIEVRTGYITNAGKLSFPHMLHTKVAIPTHYAIYITKDSSIHFVPVSEEDKKKYSS